MMSSQRERFGRGCDALVHAGVIVLLAFSPLAFGTVHAWSQALVELLVAALVAVWAGKLLVCGSTTEANERLHRWAMPLVCFIAVASLQLVPLPPLALRLLSPHTYALYRDTLPGWPEATPLRALRGTIAALRVSHERPPQIGPLPSVSAEEDSAAGAAPMVAALSELADRMPVRGAWRPLSVYTYRSGEELLRMLTYSTVFFCSSATRGRASARPLAMMRRTRRFALAYASGCSSSRPSG